MRIRLAQLCVGALISTAIASGSAFAQAALDDTTTPAADPAAPESTTASSADAVEYGVGLRLRNVRIPQAELELFVDRAPGGTSNVGFGLDLSRRRGNTELQLGFEFEHITPKEGVWIKKGDNVAAGDQADYMLSPDDAGESLGWFTVEFTFLNHAEITKGLFVRYGGGAGLGILTGSLKRIDVACNGATNDNPEPGCVPTSQGGTGTDVSGAPVKYDLPPVFPVVNAILGLQYRPTPKATINVEGGIRTILFFGVSGSYFF